MKITLRKKHLGSLSSLLMLTLVQPSANAEVYNSNTPNTLAYETQSSDEDSPSQSVILKSAYRSNGGLINVNADDLKHFAYKTDISKAFDEYFSALNELEERYQDKVDKVLDQYEQSLKLASNVSSENQIELFKGDAKCMLAKLKQQHRANQEALKLKYHIS